MSATTPWPVFAAAVPAAPWPAGWPVKASVAALPPRAPRPLAAVGHLAVDLSALAKVRPVLRRQALSLRASMAELILLNRLRARTRRELSRDTLEQAARVLEVTARHWFGDELAEPAAA